MKTKPLIYRFLPFALSIVFGLIGYVAFVYLTKHIDATKVNWWAKWLMAIIIGAAGFCIGKLFPIENNDSDGFGGNMDDFPFGAF